MDLTTDLVPTLPNGASVLPTIFESGENLERVLVQIEERALSETFDMTSEVSRKACGSLAYKVSRSKTAIADVGDKQAKALRADWDAINVHRNLANDRLNVLRDNVRAPLNEWQKAEAARVAAHEDRLTALNAVHDLTMALGSAAIKDQLAAARDVTVGDEWEEFQDEALFARASAIVHLGDILVAAEKAEAAEAELAKLRRERDERDEADRKAAAEAEMKHRVDEAATWARKQAEEKAAADLEAERDKTELEVRQSKLRADQAEADARHAVDLEREEVAARANTEREAMVKRKADEDHRLRILGTVAEAIMKVVVTPMLRDDAQLIADAIADGKIPHVTITY